MKPPRMLITADCTRVRVYQQTALGGAFSLTDAFEQSLSSREDAVRRFAAVLGRYIEQARRREDFSELVLIAPQRLRERILQQLSPETSRRLHPGLEEELSPLIASVQSGFPRRQGASPQAA